MTPEDIEKFKLEIENYNKALKDALAFSNMLMLKLEELCKDNNKLHDEHKE